MSLIISEKSPESILKASVYLLGVFCEETNERFALLHIKSEQEEEDYGPYLINRVPHDERRQIIISDLPEKNKIIPIEEIIYNKLVEFINDNCIFGEFESVKASELSNEFTRSTGIPIDIHRGFPKMMARFMEVRPDISKKTTGKGVIYMGFTFLLEEERPLHLRTRYPTNTEVSDISRVNSEIYSQNLNETIS
jgi:hypothetical protein